jgi:hypothetical protein
MLDRESDFAYGQQIHADYVERQARLVRERYGAPYRKEPTPTVEVPTKPAATSAPEQTLPPFEPVTPRGCPPAVYSPRRGVFTPTWAYRHANEKLQRMKQPRQSEPVHDGRPLPSLSWGDVI